MLANLFSPISLLYLSIILLRPIDKEEGSFTNNSPFQPYGYFLYFYRKTPQFRDFRAFSIRKKPYGFTTFPSLIYRSGHVSPSYFPTRDSLVNIRKGMAPILPNEVDPRKLSKYSFMHFPSLSLFPPHTYIEWRARAHITKRATDKNSFIRYNFPLGNPFHIFRWCLLGYAMDMAINMFKF